MNQMPGAAEAPPVAPGAGRVTLVGLGRAMLRPTTLIVLWLAVLFTALGLFEDLHLRVDRPEFSVYYLSGVALQSGLDPYAVDLERLGAESGLIADNRVRAAEPPAFILLFMPLTALAPQRAYWAWIGLNAVMLAAALLLLFGAETGLGWRLGCALVVLAIFYPPIALHFFFSRNQIPILLLLAAALRLMERRGDIAAGAALAAAGMLGVFPFLMIGYPLVFRRWRMLWSMVVFSALAMALTIPMFGVGNCLSYVHGLGELVSRQSLAYPGNIALGAFVSRLLGGGNEIFRACAAIALEVGVLALTVYASLRLWTARHEDLVWGGFALWIVATILLAPGAGVSDLVTLLIAFAIVARATVAGHASRRAIWLAVASYLLIGLGCPSCPPTPGTQLLLWRLLPLLHGPQALELAGAGFLALASAYLSCYWLVLDESHAGAGRDAGAISRA
jgi:Glycosyltransferase family 87